MKGFIIFALILAGVFILAGSLVPEKTIDQACTEQFGSRGQIAVNDCKIRALAQRALDQKDRQDAADAEAVARISKGAK